MRVKDVAVRLNVSEKTVYKWLRAGLIPARRIGKTWIITEESVQAILTPRKTPAVAVMPSGTRVNPDTDTLITTPWDTVETEIKSDTQPERDADALSRFTGILSGALNYGVEGILGPRGSDPGTAETIATALDSAVGEVLLQGIGLREFFGDHGYTTVLRQMASEDRAVQVRALLVNPVSEFARARAVAEDGFQFEDEGRFRGGPLYSDSWRSLNVIAAMRKEAESRSRFGIDVRFVDHWPSVYLVMTTESCFLETYQFGKPESAVDGSSIDGLVPMLQFASGSSYAQVLRQHFNYVWSGANPHIKIHSLADVAEAMQVTV
ncbi:MAG: helix-turn-helix domain-containing protein [Chloroflexi bacterium]|nr:helix-turn-helix domain-containing protein [Chloroflexota bacterium]